MQKLHLSPLLDHLFSLSTLAMTDQQVQELLRKGKGDGQTTRQHDYISLFSLENQAKNTETSGSSSSPESNKIAPELILAQHTLGKY